MEFNLEFKGLIFENNPRTARLLKDYSPQPIIFHRPWVSQSTVQLRACKFNTAMSSSKPKPATTHSPCAFRVTVRKTLSNSNDGSEHQPPSADALRNSYPRLSYPSFLLIFSSSLQGDAGNVKQNRYRALPSTFFITRHVPVLAYFAQLERRLSFSLLLFIFIFI